MTRVLGLTGGIGSGKSTVAQMLAALGAKLVDADELAREAVAPGSCGLRAVVARFGDEVLLADGALDRPKLGRLVFADEQARKDLEVIVHPEVARLAQEKIAEHRVAGAEIVIYDVPLLYESGLEPLFDAVIVVFVSSETQRARIRARNQLTDAEIDARIAAQMSLDEKASRADYVIDNDGPVESTETQVAELWAQLTGPKNARRDAP